MAELWVDPLTDWVPSPPRRPWRPWRWVAAAAVLGLAWFWLAAWCVATGG